MSAVVDTDRTKLKKQRQGVAVASPIDPNVANQCDEESFTFEIGSDASIAEMGFSSPKKFKLKAIRFTPATALAANGASYITMVVSKRDGAGGAAAPVVSMDTNTAGASTDPNISLAAFVPYDFKVSAVVTTGLLTFTSPNVLTFKSTETGTPATPIGKVVVTVEYV